MGWELGAASLPPWVGEVVEIHFPLDVKTASSWGNEQREIVLRRHPTGHHRVQTDSYRRVHTRPAETLNQDPVQRMQTRHRED